MVLSSEKSCFKCGETKPLSHFYKHSGMSDGHVNKCKDCNKQDVNENRRTRQDYYSAYDRLRNATEHRRECKRKSNAQPHVAKRIAEYKSTYSYSQRRKAATTAVGSAIRDGRLVKTPCWICGELEVEGHHPNYDSPLDVVWLCKPHHSEIHRLYDHNIDRITLEKTEKGSRWK